MAQGAPLETVGSFWYLGSLLRASGSDWPAVQANLQKARRNWARIIRVLMQEGATPRMVGNFF